MLVKMREIPLLMKQYNIARIKEGRKVVTRRPIKWDSMADGSKNKIAYNKGDIIWLKEGFYRSDTGDILYLDEVNSDIMDNCGKDNKWKKVSPLFMPKKVSRIWLQVVIDSYIQRLNHMTELDAMSEGGLSLAEFIREWNILYMDKPKYQWAANPYVWVIRFRKLDNSWIENRKNELD